VPTYDDLRKTQAEVELQTKLRSVQPLHKSSNAASLKVEAVRQETPELPSQSPSGQVQEPQTQTPEPEPVLPWKVRYDADERDLQTRKTDYAEAIKTEDFERKEAMDKEIVGRMKENGYDGRSIEDFKRSVNQSHNAVGNYAKADEFLTQKERHKSFSDEERKLEGQYKWEQTQAKMAQLAAQKRGGARPASQTWQDGPTRPAIPPLPGQAPEPQTAVKIAGNTADPDKASQDAERQARIVAQKQAPNSQAETEAAPKIEGKAEDLAKNRNADAERQARIAAQKRGEAPSEETPTMSPPVPKPHIRR
jgi:hypothetical protein